MEEKLYKVFTFGEDISFYEIDRFKEEENTYLLLLQREDPYLIVVGLLDKNKVRIVQDDNEHVRLLRKFFPNKVAVFEKLRPFFKNEEDARKILNLDDKKD